MSVLAVRLGAPDRWEIHRLLPAAAVLVALAGVVAARWLATRAGVDALAVGAAFGLALGAIAALAGVRARSTSLRTIAPLLAVGAIAGLALVVLAALGPALAGATTIPGLGRPAAPFLPWVGITILAAAAEEVVLRGALFDHVERLGGVGGALVVTTVVFALLHVPLYGWHVVPLDLGVGLALGGLRVVTRSVLVPAAAHAVADLATWWL